MSNVDNNIMVWLPSPMGDAILSTPALKAIRNKFISSKITFFAGPVVHQVLSPSNFANEWLEQNGGFLDSVRLLKNKHFTHAILLKNSFGSAVTCRLAGIPVRTGYSRDGRGVLLTQKLHPPKLSCGDYKPISVVDYYLAIAARLGADITDKNIELSVEPSDFENLKTKLPAVFNANGPVIIFVPGAAAGPSKRWLPERFARAADWLSEKYNAAIVLSVAPNEQEKDIAAKIINSAEYKVVNLADSPIGLGELKALIAGADLVICNDTGPRHIAIGLKRKVMTLVGPNNPEWTDPGYEDEIFIKGNVSCAPCDKPICKEKSHFCMEAITVEMVCNAAEKILNAAGFEKRGG